MTSNYQGTIKNLTHFCDKKLAEESLNRVAIRNGLIKSICDSLTKKKESTITTLSKTTKGLLMCIGSIAILSPRHVVDDYIQITKKLPHHEQFHELLTKDFSNIKNQFNYAKLSLFGHMLTIVTEPGKNRMVDDFRSKIHAKHIWDVDTITFNNNFKHNTTGLSDEQKCILVEKKLKYKFNDVKNAAEKIMDDWFNNNEDEDDDDQVEKENQVKININGDD